MALRDILDKHNSNGTGVKHLSCLKQNDTVSCHLYKNRRSTKLDVPSDTRLDRDKIADALERDSLGNVTVKFSEKNSSPRITEIDGPADTIIEHEDNIKELAESLHGDDDKIATSANV